jgi:hypothetical protein
LRKDAFYGRALTINEQIVGIYFSRDREKSGKPSLFSVMGASG